MRRVASSEGVLERQRHPRELLRFRGDRAARPRLPPTVPEDAEAPGDRPHRPLNVELTNRLRRGPLGVEGDRTGLVAAHQPMPDVRAAADPGQDPQQPGPAELPADRHVEQPVGRVGRRADPVAAAVRRGVADGDEDPVDCRGRAVQPDGVPARAQPEHLGHDRHVVPAGSPGVAHAVGPLVDQRVEPGAEYPGEPPERPVGQLGPPQVQHPGTPLRQGGDDRRRGGRDGTGEAQVGGDVVARTGGHDRERDTGTGDGLQPEVDRTVATDRHQSGRSGLQRRPARHRYQTGALRAEHLDRSTRPPQPVQYARHLAPVPPTPGGRVDQDGQGAGHVMSS